MNSQINARIRAQLEHIVATENITILIAIESGSRAWGFASRDSDYDVRFIYARPLNDYIRISQIRDVIELPIIDDLDINGWDVKKALELLLKSNPPVMEWLSSPIVYSESPAAELIRKASKELFDPVKTAHHYLSMATKNYKHLQPDMVFSKKYLYVLRPLICLDWIIDQGSMPPMQFDNLMRASAAVKKIDEVATAIENLLHTKKIGKETDKQQKNTILDTYIQQRLAYYSAMDFGKSKPPNYALADEVFRKILYEV